MPPPAPKDKRTKQNMQPQQNTPVGVRVPRATNGQLLFWSLPSFYRLRGWVPGAGVPGTGQNPSYPNAHPPLAPRKARLIPYLWKAVDSLGL